MPMSASFAALPVSLPDTFDASFPAKSKECGPPNLLAIPTAGLNMYSVATSSPADKNAALASCSSVAPSASALPL